MQVFKAFFKIIKKNIPMLMIYIIIFVGVTVGFSASGQGERITQFAERRSPVVLINNDADTPLTRAFTEYIGKKARLVEVPDEDEALRDALFFRKAESVIRIPRGFTQKFLNGEETAVEKTSAPDSIGDVHIDMLLDNFLGTAGRYVRHLPGVTEEKLAAMVREDLTGEADILVRQYGTGSNPSGLTYHFNFASYPMTIILILGITSCMMAFNDTLLKRRTLCSPVAQSRVSLELLLGCLIFTAVIWSVMFAAIVLMTGDGILSTGGFLLSVNLFIIALVGLCISFLVGSLIKSKNVQSAVANTVALSMSFLCGAFVPQDLLSREVLAVGRFLPLYWYVYANDKIGALRSFGPEELQPILIGFLIQLGFAAALVSVTLVINRQRRTAAS